MLLTVFPPAAEGQSQNKYIGTLRIPWKKKDMSENYDIKISLLS